jgi:hypothetical protein
VDVLDYLGNSEFAQWVNQSWGWPAALTVHAFGTATIVGLMAIMGLRVFGLFRTIPYSSLNRLIPLIWIALLFQAISGFTLWMTKPGQYLADGMFEVKFTLVIIASIVMVYFHGMMKRETNGWETAGNVSARGVKLTAAICLLWAGVTIGGRLTAYLGSLYAG